jgi:Fe-S-cluster containining protein
MASCEDVSMGVGTATVHCENCLASCCRLLVRLLPGDRVPGHLLAEDDHGLQVMAQRDDGWCIALDRGSLRCTIYRDRPQVCRDFAMGSPECLVERAVDGLPVHAGEGR